MEAAVLRRGASEEEVVEMWLGRARQRSGSEATVRAYTAALRRFRAHLGRDVLTCTPSEALWYAQALADSGLAPASQAQHLSALRSLGKFAADLGVVPHSPWALVRVPRQAAARAAHVLSLDEVRALLGAARPRARALVLLLATTGLRISEALAATWDDVYTDPAGRTGLRVVGKGGRVRQVKLLPEVLAALRPWQRAGGPLWPGEHGGRASRQAADAMLRRTCAAAGLPQVGPHALRHWLATQALAAGADLLRVQDDLGHASMDTTRRYLHLAQGLRETTADAVGRVLGMEGT